MQGVRNMTELDHLGHVDIILTCGAHVEGDMARETWRGRHGACIEVAKLLVACKPPIEKDVGHSFRPQFLRRPDDGEHDLSAKCHTLQLVNAIAFPNSRTVCRTGSYRNPSAAISLSPSIVL
jgi:hypothetical protein